MSKEEGEGEREEEELLRVLTTSLSTAQSFLDRNEAVLSPTLSLELESLLSSAAQSLARLSLPAPHPPPNTHLSFFNTLLSDTTSPLWSQTLRLSHPSFLHLLTLLPPNLPPVSLAATLFRLAHSAPYSSLSRRFSLGSSSSACRSFFSACKAINDSLRPDSPPPNSPLPSCRGALGFHKFSVQNTPGILVLAVVDSQGKFVDVSAGWPGNLSPELILHQTKLYSGLEDSAQDDANESSSISPYFVGDSCFPLMPWLLTPYPSDDDISIKRVFNQAHKDAMRAVEEAFLCVRRRWRILDRIWKEECLQFLPFLVTTCCLLHNFAVNCGEPIAEEHGDCDLGGRVEEDGEEGFGTFEGEVSESGERVRDAVATHLAQVSFS